MKDAKQRSARLGRRWGKITTWDWAQTRVACELASVVFSIGHLGVARFYGRFTGVSGRYELDFDDLEQSSIEIEVESQADALIAARFSLSRTAT